MSGSITSISQGALQYGTALWISYGGSSDSNSGLLLLVLALKVARIRGFSLCEYSLSFYIFHKHRVYLVDCVD